MDKIKVMYICTFLYLFTLRGQGGVAWGPSTKNCFIVFMGIGGHGGLKTFYGIEKYCPNPKISRFQNSDYHR